MSAQSVWAAADLKQYSLDSLLFNTFSITILLM